MDIKVICDACGSVFRIKTEYAGRRGKCSKCGAVVIVPTPAENEDPASQIEIVSASAVPDQVMEAIPIDEDIEGEYGLAETTGLPARHTPGTDSSEATEEYTLQASQSEPHDQEDEPPQRPAKTHLDIKGHFGMGGTRYEIAQSPFGSTVLRVHRMRGDKPVGKPKEHNLSLYEELAYIHNEGAGFLENMKRFAIWSVILGAGCGIFGILLIFLLGLPGPDWGGRPQAVLREKADVANYKDPTFLFRDVSKLRQFVNLIGRSRTVSMNCLD